MLREPDVAIEAPAIPASVPLVRDLVVHVCRSLGVTQSLLDDVALAVTEAAANSARHAYPAFGRPGIIRVTVSVRDDEVALVVEDEGRASRRSPRPRAPVWGSASSAPSRTPPTSGRPTRAAAPASAWPSRASFEAQALPRAPFPRAGAGVERRHAWSRRAARHAPPFARQGAADVDRGARRRRRAVRRGRARAPHRVRGAQALVREGRRPLGAEEGEGPVRPALEGLDGARSGATRARRSAASTTTATRRTSSTNARSGWACGAARG